MGTIAPARDRGARLTTLPRPRSQLQTSGVLPDSSCARLPLQQGCLADGSRPDSRYQRRVTAFVLLLSFAAAPPASTPWEEEAAAIAAEDERIVEGRTRQTAQQREAQRLFWTQLGVGGGAVAVVSVASAAAATTLVSTDEQGLSLAGTLTFVAIPLVTSSVAGLSAAAIMLFYDRPLKSTALVTGATVLAVGLATAAGGAAAIALQPFLVRLTSSGASRLRIATAVALSASVGMVAAATASAALVPSFLASSYFVE